MRHRISPRSGLGGVLAVGVALAAGLAGCHGDANTPEAQAAEKAVGLAPTTETSKSVTADRQVSVVKETKVVDDATGQVLSDQKEVTPVKIRQEKKVTTDVKVNVGDTTGTRAPAQK